MLKMTSSNHTRSLICTYVCMLRRDNVEKSSLDISLPAGSRRSIKAQVLVRCVSRTWLLSEKKARTNVDLNQMWLRKAKKKKFMRAQARHRRRVNREFDPSITSVSSRWWRKQRIIVDRHRTRYFETKPAGVNWLLNTSIHVDARFTRPVEEWLWHTRSVILDRRRTNWYVFFSPERKHDPVRSFSFLLYQDQIRAHERKFCRRKWEHAPLIALSLAATDRVTASCQGKGSRSHRCSNAINAVIVRQTQRASERVRKRQASFFSPSF